MLEKKKAVWPQWTPFPGEADPGVFRVYTGWPQPYGLSLSGFAINLSLIMPRNSGNRANPENDSPKEITHKIKKFSTKFDDLGVIIMRKRCSIQQAEKR